jgi:hypothetical protein
MDLKTLQKTKRRIGEESRGENMMEINLFIEHHQFTELMQPKQPAGKRDA